jgi:hypothetical protein
VALVLAWAFEITPEGIKRESEVAPHVLAQLQAERQATIRGFVSRVKAVANSKMDVYAFRLTSSP